MSKMRTAQDLLDLLKNVEKQTALAWVASCPGPGHANGDEHQSLSIAQKDDRILVHCHTGCRTQDVVAAVGWTMAMLNLNAKFEMGSDGITLAELIAAKHLDPGVLQKAGVKDGTGQYRDSVVIPYYGVDGNEAAIHRRVSLTGSRFKWRTGDHVLLYGIWLLSKFREIGSVLLVEGETDCWTAWSHGIPALGLPGKGTWQTDWAKLLDGIEVYLWVEPDADDLIARVGSDMPGLKVIKAPPFAKDINAADDGSRDLVGMLDELRASAIPVQLLFAKMEEEAEKERQAALQDAREAATPVLLHPDPMEIIATAIKTQGYGGDQSTPNLIYLCATTRLLELRKGSMPAHVILIGPPGAGKSYGWTVVRRHLPEEAYLAIDASSPRTLIYEDRSFQHRIVMYGEADSLPSGEDNPAASAVRNLLQENELNYDLTVRDEETGKFAVEHIHKDGPTVVITSAIKGLGEQLMSRLFVLDVPEDQRQIESALTTQAALEIDGAPDPDEPLIAFQRYLQLLAPIDVIVPFAKELAHYLASQPAKRHRVTRDFSRLLALIKAVVIIRIAHRTTDAKGRFVATLDDYDAVYNLAAEMYRSSASGASRKVREVVEAVASLRAEKGDVEQIRNKDVQARVGWPAMTGSRHIAAALRGGWLINRADEKKPKDLIMGVALPTEDGLPSPETLRDLVAALPPPVSDGSAVAVPDLSTKTATAGDGIDTATNGSGSDVVPDLSTNPGDSSIATTLPLFTAGDLQGTEHRGLSEEEFQVFLKRTGYEEIVQ